MVSVRRLVPLVRVALVALLAAVAVAVAPASRFQVRAVSVELVV